ncbi:MAG: hypothetical protein FWG03_02290, partial [Clostridiales bacterium]|nr:hypothetical protein [Clostridiales bacterium]
LTKWRNNGTNRAQSTISGAYYLLPAFHPKYLSIYLIIRTFGFRRDLCQNRRCFLRIAISYQEGRRKEGEEGGRKEGRKEEGRGGRRKEGEGGRRKEGEEGL